MCTSIHLGVSLWASSALGMYRSACMCLCVCVCVCVCVPYTQSNLTAGLSAHSRTNTHKGISQDMLWCPEGELGLLGMTSRGPLSGPSSPPYTVHQHVPPPPPSLPSCCCCSRHPSGARCMQRLCSRKLQLVMRISQRDSHGPLPLSLISLTSLLPFSLSLSLSLFTAKEKGESRRAHISNPCVGFLTEGESEKSGSVEV